MHKFTRNNAVQRQPKFRPVHSPFWTLSKGAVRTKHTRWTKPGWLFLPINTQARLEPWPKSRQNLPKQKFFPTPFQRQRINILEIFTLPLSDSSFSSLSPIKVSDSIDVSTSPQVDSLHWGAKSSLREGKSYWGVQIPKKRYLSQSKFKQFHKSQRCFQKQLTLQNSKNCV